MAGLFVLLLALRLWWGWEAHRQLQAEIDRIVAAGEPLFPTDFGSFEQIPDIENAATFYLRAGAGFFGSPAFQIIQELTKPTVVTSVRLEEVRLQLQANATRLADIHTARNRSRVDWHVVYGTPIVGTLIFEVPNQTTLILLTTLAARYHHAVGADSLALECLRDAIAHLEALESYPFLVAHSRASAKMVRLCAAVEEMAPTLLTQDRREAMDNLDHADQRAVIRLIISELLDEHLSQQAMLQGMFEARMGALDLVESILNSRLSLSSAMDLFGEGHSYQPMLDSTLFLPMVAQDGVFLLRGLSQNVAASRTATFPEAFAMYWKPRSRPERWHSIYQLSHPFSQEYQRLTGSFFETHFMGLAMRRMAATRLALRLFELENGFRATSLNMLVPTFLPAVPRDPFAHGNAPIRFRSEAEPALLYCLGPNGIDDEGRWEGKPDRGDERLFDIPFFLEAPSWTNTPTNRNAAPDSK